MNTWLCPQCSRDNPETRTFCRSCGKPNEALLAKRSSEKPLNDEERNADMVQLLNRQSERSPVGNSPMFLIIAGVTLLVLKYGGVIDLGHVNGERTYVTHMLLSYWETSFYAAEHIDPTNSTQGVCGLILLFGGIALLVIKLILYPTVAPKRLHSVPASVLSAPQQSHTEPDKALPVADALDKAEAPPSPKSKNPNASSQ